MNKRQVIFYTCVGSLAVLIIVFICILRNKDMVFRDYYSYSYSPPKSSTNTPFPQIIHQTWKTPQLTEKQKLWQNSIKKIYPTFSYKLWTDDDLPEMVKMYFPKFYPIWNTLSKKEKIEASKYILMYVYGGIYFDLDIIASKSLQFILTQFPNSAFIPCNHHEPIWEEDENAVSSSILASYPGNPLWLMALDHIITTGNCSEISLANILRKIHKTPNNRPNIIILSEPRLGLSFRMPKFSRRFKMSDAR